MVVHAGNHSTQMVEAGGLDIQGYPQLRREFVSNLSYMTPCHCKQTRKEGVPEMTLGTSTCYTSIRTGVQIPQPHTKLNVASLL